MNFSLCNIIKVNKIIALVLQKRFYKLNRFSVKCTSLKRFLLQGVESKTNLMKTAKTCVKV